MDCLDDESIVPRLDDIHAIFEQIFNVENGLF